MGVRTLALAILTLIMNVIGMAATAWWAVLDPTPLNVVSNLVWLGAAVMAGRTCVASWRTIRIERELRRIQAEYDARQASLYRTYWMQDEMRRIQDETDR